MRQMSQSTMRKAADAQNKRRRSRQQEREERRQRLEAHAAELEAENTLEVGKRYRVNRPSHMEHGREVEVTHTAGGALRAAIADDRCWTLWSGWSPGQALIRVGIESMPWTSWIEPRYLEPVD